MAKGYARHADPSNDSMSPHFDCAENVHCVEFART